MKETGYINLWDVECIFIIKYNPTVGCATAFIERVEFGISQVIKLFPKYTIERCHKDVFSGFEITGEALDDFFSPAQYFYDRLKEETESNVDFIYHSEVVDKWSITFENKPVTVTLSYGDILHWGIGSDLMLHPKLTIAFEQTTDTQYVYRVYSFIVRFLQIVRYDIKCGKLRIDLFYEEQGKMSYNGHLYDLCIDQDRFCISANEVEYGCYKTYIQRFLQFVAGNLQYNHEKIKNLQYDEDI